ncbi:MAG: histidine kinase [Saprospiraceae bacterium]|nr:histidine kinase [Saprospiraceae bacterium]
MLFNTKRRIKYLGFNDFWFCVIGILILSFVTDYLFSNSFTKYPFHEAIIAWSISLFFTICNWLFMRMVLIFLRIKLPAFEDSIKRIALVFLILVISVVVIDMIGNMVLSSIYGFKYNPMSRAKVLLPIVLISTMIQAIYEAIYHYIRLKKAVREEEQAKQMIVQVQLDALRNQAQPHFLFNTLNTLRDIIDQNSKEEAKEFVDKISDVYRFILENGNENLTVLKNELKFCRAYMHIQKERFGENIQVKWDIPDLSLNAMIVPMSLQLLLENAIKHNIISKSKPLIIEVYVQDEFLCVKNNIQPKTSQVPSTKLGIKNIEKRYQLISEKSVEIDTRNQHFVVSLPLLAYSEKKAIHANSNY